MLARRPFGRRPAAAPAQDRDERLAQRAARALASARATAGMSCASAVVMGPATGQAQPQPKTEILSCEAYRRAVASLPCISCGIHGYSQHAHLNLGKGFAPTASNGAVSLATRSNSVDSGPRACLSGRKPHEQF